MATSCGEGWICQDCIQYIANGEAPEHMTEDEAEDWKDSLNLERFQYVALGGTHEPYCEDEDNCSCMEDPFSMSSCDLCRSGLGGARYRVTFMQSS